MLLSFLLLFSGCGSNNLKEGKLLNYVRISEVDGALKFIGNIDIDFDIKKHELFFTSGNKLLIFGDFGCQNLIKSLQLPGVVVDHYYAGTPSLGEDQTDRINSYLILLCKGDATNLVVVNLIDKDIVATECNQTSEDIILLSSTRANLKKIVNVLYVSVNNAIEPVIVCLSENSQTLVSYSKNGSKISELKLSKPIAIPKQDDNSRLLFGYDGENIIIFDKTKTGYKEKHKYVFQKGDIENTIVDYAPNVPIPEYLNHPILAINDKIYLVGENKTEIYIDSKIIGNGMYYDTFSTVDGIYQLGEKDVFEDINKPKKIYDKPLIPISSIGLSLNYLYFFKSNSDSEPTSYYLINQFIPSITKIDNIYSTISQTAHDYNTNTLYLYSFNTSQTRTEVYAINLDILHQFKD